MPRSFNFWFCRLSRNWGQWLPEGNPLLPTLSTQAEHSTLLSCVTSFRAAERLRWHPQPLLPGCQSERRQAWAITAEAGGTPEEQSPNSFLWSSKTQRNRSTLRAPLQSCCPGWVDGKEGDYCQRATEAATGQLPFGELLCSCTGCHEADERDSFPQCLPGCPACFWEPVECYSNIVYFVNFLLPSIDE